MPAKKEIDRTALINFMKNGATKTHIAKSLNVNRVTLWNYLKNNPITSAEMASGYEIQQAKTEPKKEPNEEGKNEHKIEKAETPKVKKVKGNEEKKPTEKPTETGEKNLDPFDDLIQKNSSPQKPTIHNRNK